MAIRKVLIELAQTLASARAATIYNANSGGSLDEVNVMRTPSLMCDLGTQVDQLAHFKHQRVARC
jgi:hypothetical protein